MTSQLLPLSNPLEIIQQLFQLYVQIFILLPINIFAVWPAQFAYSAVTRARSYIMKQPQVSSFAKSISKSASQLIISSPLEEAKPVCVYDHVEGYVLLFEQDEQVKFTPRELGKLLKPRKKNDKRAIIRENLYYATLDGQMATLTLKPHLSTSGNDTLVWDVCEFNIDLSMPNPDTKKFSRLFPILMTQKSTKKTYRIIFSTGIAKEQWYIALKKSSTLLRSAVLPSLDFDPQISPLNALMIRVWNSVSTTQKFHQAVRDRITRRLDATKKPAFIGELKVKSIKIGSEPPLLYNLALENTRDALVVGGHWYTRALLKLSLTPR